MDIFLGILVFLVGVILVVALVWAVVYMATPWSEKELRKAYVKSLSHQEGHANVGTGIGANGQLVTTSTYTAEEWDVVLMVNGYGKHVEDDENLWDDVSQGDVLEVVVRTKTVWGEQYLDLISWKHVNEKITR